MRNPEDKVLSGLQIMDLLGLKSHSSDDFTRVGAMELARQDLNI